MRKKIGTQIIKPNNKGSRPKIIGPDWAGFWFIFKAYPPVHIGICVGGCNAEDESKEKQDGHFFFAEVFSDIKIVHSLRAQL